MKHFFGLTGRAVIRYIYGGQCFLSQSLIKCFLDTLIQKRLFQIMRIDSVPGDLTNISAIKEALMVDDAVFRRKWSYWCV